MCYGAQVWGFMEYELVEKLLRFAIKKIFYLPQNTPNYMLHVEFDLNTLYLHTLNQHFTYILKTLDMPKSRLPHIISKEIIKSKLFWFNKWSTLSNNNPGLIDINNIKTWKMENMQTLLTNIYLKTKTILYYRCKTQHCTQYINFH